MEHDRKTEEQARIELLITNNRGYFKFPRKDFSCEEIALRSWLKYSNFRVLSLTNDLEEVPMDKYLQLYSEKEILRITLSGKTTNSSLV